MVNMLQISSSKNPYGENRWYIIYLCAGIASSKTLYEKPQRKNSHKEKSTMHIMSEYHPPKNLVGKTDDMTYITLCWYCLIKNFTWETPRKKLIKKECNMMFATCYYSQRLSPDICKSQSKFIPMHSTHKKCRVW